MGKHCEELEEADPDSDGAIDETLPVEEEQPLAPVLVIKKTRYATPYAFCRGKLKPLSKTRHAKRWPTSKQSKIRLTTTPIPPSRRNQDLHLAQIVALAIQFQVPYSRPLKLAPTLILSTFFHVSKLSSRHVATSSLETAIENKRDPQLNNRIIRLVARGLEHLWSALNGCEPRRYKELTRYRDVIQKTNRKVVWSAVCNYDVQFCLSLTLNTSARFNTIGKTLYTTILDSSVVRKDGIFW